MSAEGTGFRFSWGLVLAGAAVACATTLFLLTLGSGVGLLLVHPETDTQTPPAFLTGGAIYFFVAQAFGFAAGAHVAGRLMGSVRETVLQEEIRAALHGLVVWAVAVLGTALMIALAGATTAALYGVAKPQTPAEHSSAVLVDRLFRPGPTPTTVAAPPNRSEAPSAAIQTAPAPVQQAPVRHTDSGQARAEAGRLIDTDFAPGAAGLDAEDRARLTQLVAEQAGVSAREASLRVSAAESQLHATTQRATLMARKLGSYVSLWIAFSLLFGAVAAMVSAVTARIEDDRESPWAPSFFRGRQ